MTEEMQKYDLNGDGVIDAEERRIMLEDMRRKMEDEDAQRDSIRKMAWFALAGLLLYPFGIFCADALSMGTAASLIADIAPTYFASIAVLVSAFFGASALGAKKKEGGQVKACKYFYNGGMYHTECGLKALFRPAQRCDKCGKKPQERK